MAREIRILFNNVYDMLGRELFYCSVNPQIHFTQESEGALRSIEVDLPREHFVSSNGKTFNDHVAVWNAPADNSYTQGNMTGAFFTDVIYQGNFLKPGFLETRDLSFEAYIRSVSRVRFAYFNDDGIPCGVSISFSKQDPSYWIAAIIINTPAIPQERQVLLLSPKDVIVGDDEEVFGVAQAEYRFNTHLNSREVQNLFRGVFLANGTVHVRRLNLLKDQLDENFQNFAAADLDASETEQELISNTTPITTSYFSAGFSLKVIGALAAFSGIAMIIAVVALNILTAAGLAVMAVTGAALILGGIHFFRSGYQISKEEREEQENMAMTMSY